MPPFTLSISTLASKMPQRAEAGSMPPFRSARLATPRLAMLDGPVGPRDRRGADGVEDYCAQLREAFLEQGVPFEMLRMPLAEQSWRSSLAWLRGRLAAHDPSVVLLQYNALSWSRRGFSVGALLVLRTLKRHTSRVGCHFSRCRAISWHKIARPHPPPGADLGHAAIDKKLREIHLRLAGRLFAVVSRRST